MSFNQIIRLAQEIQVICNNLSSVIALNDLDLDLMEIQVKARTIENIVEDGMGYNKTPQAFEKVKGLLDELLESDKDVEWIFNNPRTVRMNIYEGLNYAVRSKKKELEKYNDLLDRYKLKVIEPTILKAELKTPNIIVPNGRIERENENGR